MTESNTQSVADVLERAPDQRLALVPGASLGELSRLAALAALGGGAPLFGADFGSREYFRLDLFADPWERLETVKEIIGYKRLRQRRAFPAGSTSKRAKVKAARKANVRRMRHDG